MLFNRNGHEMDSKGKPLVVNLLKGTKHPEGKRVSCLIAQLFPENCC